MATLDGTSGDIYSIVAPLLETKLRLLHPTRCDDDELRMRDREWDKKEVMEDVVVHQQGAVVQYVLASRFATPRLHQHAEAPRTTATLDALHDFPAVPDFCLIGHGNAGRVRAEPRR